MTNKNPYEIRTEILSMAKEYLDRQFDLQQSLYIDMCSKIIENAVSFEDVMNSMKEIKKYTPQVYDIDELNKVASHMYNFVNHKGE